MADPGGDPRMTPQANLRPEELPEALNGQLEAPAQETAEVTELMRLGIQRYQANDFEGAVRIFKMLVGATPDRALSWNHLSLALISLDRRQEAVAALRRSLKIDPRQAQTWNSLASALTHLGLYAEADAACGAALTYDLESAAGWEIRAIARTGLNDFPAATEAFLKVLDLDGPSAPLCANLGAAMLKCGRFEDAAVALSAAARLDPAGDGRQDEGAEALGLANRLAGELAEPAAATDAQTDRLYKTALLLLDQTDRADAAVRVAEAWAARRPDNIEALHLRDSVTARPVDRQPAELVAQRFDEMAEDFDATLIGRLGYDGPGRLAALLTPQTLPAGGLDVLDLGCGTGLCAGVLKPYARQLVGVDLSGKMLAKAQERGLYDRLDLADLVEALAGPPGQWDLICAFDTFPYLGALGEVFAATALALRPGGWFAFSTEHGQGDDYLLRGNGRYAHGAAYIEAVAGDRFDIVLREEAMLRREGGRAVDGGYYLLRLRA
jgi:predicted TPR repeat methyltransferase